jgi:hypothetical protein
LACKIFATIKCSVLRGKFFVEKLCILGFVACVCCINTLATESIGDDSDIYVDFNASYLTPKTREEIVAIRKSRPEEERFKKCKEEWTLFCEDGYKGYNSYDTGPLETQLYAEMGNDPVASGGLSIFLEANKSWEFIDYCAEHLNAMSATNQQKFRELLILIAPGMISTRYMKRAVTLVGRVQEEVRKKDIQYVPFCRDALFVVAVKNARFGRVGMGNMFKAAFFALWPTDNAGQKNDESFDSLEIAGTMQNGVCFDDPLEIFYRIERLYPNWEKN